MSLISFVVRVKLHPLPQGWNRAQRSSLDAPSKYYLNWPLCDIDDDNGPFEIAAGMHRLVGQCRVDRHDSFFLELEQAHRQIVDGNLPLRRLHMRKGDMMIRDPRCLHRASPNLTTVDRPMMVILFLASAERAKSQSNHCPSMTQDTWESLGGAQQRLLRVIPVVNKKGGACCTAKF
jgi:ectoine hydroxylase-related dioxygenase (phytanoyl-CoA dioxygenase family)